MGRSVDSKVVLVVDDEPFARLLAVQVFLDEGYTVLEAADAAEALAILEANDDISLLFTDINMPGDLDGVDLIERVRESRPEIALVATSGHGHPVAARVPASAAFLAKPYMVHTLSETVRQLAATRGCAEKPQDDS